MKPMKRLTAVLLAAGLLLSLAACGGTENLSESSQPSSQSQQESSSGSEESSAAQTGGGRWDSLQATEEEVTLYVDLNNSTPTVNEEPTEESPTVRNAARIVAEQWLADKPNVSIEWTRNKVMGTSEAFLEWMTIQLNASTAPDVLHAWGAQFADKGWYLELDEVMESPNYYEPGNTSWKEMYPDYLWEDPMFINANNNIMAIPHTVYPGPPTVYYYNTQIFQELGIQETNDWATFHEEMQKVKEAGYTAFAPASTDANGWDIQFSLSPYYAISFQDQWDQDGNEIMSTRESTRSIYNGVWYMETNPAVFEMYSLVKDKLQNTCDEGYEGIDYTQAWKDGQVAIIEDGIWRFPTENSNTERTFDFGMMAPPVIQTSEYVDPVEFTEAGPYKPQPMEALTIVKASQQGRPEYQEDYVVDFMKFVHTTENLSMIIEERAGDGMGATKTCAVPAILSDWMSKSFPQKPNAMVPSSCTTDGVAKINKLFEQWVKDMVDDDYFKAEYDKILYEDLKLYMEQQQVEIDDTWEEYVPASAQA